MADYASISIVNTHLFRALQEGAGNAQACEKRKAEQFLQMQKELQSLLQSAINPLDLLLTGEPGGLSFEQQEVMKTAQASIQQAMQLTTDWPLKAATNQPIKNG
jgi:hypothetical protein